MFTPISARVSATISPGLGGAFMGMAQILGYSRRHQRTVNRRFTVGYSRIPGHSHSHLAALTRPSLWLQFTLEKQRVQGRPGADRTHGPRATKSTRQNHRYEPNIRPSLREWVTAYT
jgi:hypothetical protein